LKNIVVFASGSGTNFQSVIDAVNTGEIQAVIKGLVTNNPNAAAIERAKKNNIEVYIIRQNTGSHQLLEKLQLWNPSLIVLAGFLKKIPEEIITEFEGKIINIHPSLLPKYGGKGYYGLHVHRAVLENNESETGCSVHLVTCEYDEGPVIARRKVPVYPDDTPEVLAQRVLKKEHELLPLVISKLLNKNQVK